MAIRVDTSLSFLDEKPSEKTTFGQSVITALIANAAKFPNLPIPTETLTEYNDELASGDLAARTGDRTAIAALKNVEKTWDGAFRLTAAYVGIVADGDETTIRLAFFEPTKSQRTPATKPGITGNFRALVNGGKGTFFATCDAVSGAKTYVFLALPEGFDVSFNGDMLLLTAGNVTAQIQVTTKRKAQFTNLTSGVEISAGVFAVNSAGAGPLANGQTVRPQ